MKKTISVLLALVLLLGAFPFALPAAAADDPQTYSGTCGSNIEWTLEDGVLTVSGDGAIEPQKRPSTVDNVTWNEATQKIEYTTSPFVSEGSFPWDDVLVRIYTEHFRLYDIFHIFPEFINTSCDNITQRSNDY